MKNINFFRKKTTEHQNVCIVDWELYHEIKGTKEKTLRLLKKTFREWKKQPK